MACIIFPDNRRSHDVDVIQEHLAGLGIALREWPVPQQPQIRELLERQSLDEEQRATVLEAIAHRLEELRLSHGYSTCDMVVMHEHVPGLADMLAKFEKIHYHSDDEVRYIIAGRGYFGFVGTDGDQFMVEVTAGDYINVPARTEHWFTLGDSKRIKAVRYFIDTSGWAPVYTDRPLAFSFQDEGAPTRGSAA